jgi:hypothetical protein
MSDDFNLADVLDESREYIEEHGWAQGEFIVYEENAMVGVCSIGAVLYSQSIPEHECCSHPVVKAVSIALIKSLDLPPLPHQCVSNPCSCLISRVTTWNDLSNRTEQEVLDGFAKAAKIARAGFDPDAA